MLFTYLHMISTGIKKLDHFLGGGIKSGIITDIFGATGTGKTQLAMQITINSLLHGGQVLFQDTTGQFRPERMLDMIKTRNLEHNMLDRVKVGRITNASEQIQYLSKIKETNFSLVVIDNVTDLFSFEFNKEDQNLEKNVTFMEYMHELSFISIQKKLPIIVTNMIRQIDDLEKENLAKPISMFTHIKIKLLKKKRATNLPLDLNLIAKFYSLGFKQLTEIQKKAVPIIYQKKDTLVIAPTGSGKTECSVIPIFSHIKLSKKLGKIKAIYVTPLRALNRDVFRRIVRYAENDGLSIEIRHGDTPQSTRKKISNSPPDILITTPETLVILLTQKKMLDALSELEWIVIDEVHELLGNERGSQLSLSLERLQLNSNLEITRIGLSATIGNPEESGKFVVGTKRKLKIIRDTTIRKYDVKVKYIEGTISDVAQYIIEFVTEQDLQSPVLLFTNTRGESEFLASILKEKSTLNIELHHGSLSRQVREETEDSLREGKKGIVVCTSSLELGLDIGSIELVIHYGSPRKVSNFTPRRCSDLQLAAELAKLGVGALPVADEYEANAILERIKQG